MISGSFRRILDRIIGPFVDHKNNTDISDSRYFELIRRIEGRAYLASLEARAQFSVLEASQMEMARLTEERALLATLEAKAYADGAMESLTMSLRAITKVVLQVSQRIDALETIRPDLNKLEERLADAEHQLNSYRELALNARMEAFGARLNAIANRHDEKDRLGEEIRREIDRINGDARNISADMVDLASAFREIDGRFREMTRNLDIQRFSHMPGPHPPLPSDTTHSTP